MEFSRGSRPAARLPSADRARGVKLAPFSIPAPAAVVNPRRLAGCWVAASREAPNKWTLELVVLLDRRERRQRRGERPGRRRIRSVFHDVRRDDDVEVGILRRVVPDVKEAADERNIAEARQLRDITDFVLLQQAADDE
jgi:hypothetical protein